MISTFSFAMQFVHVCHRNALLETTSLTLPTKIFYTTRMKLEVDRQVDAI